MGAIVGRARELAEIDAALSDARAGRGRLLLLSGPPGIGKSRLADAAVEQAAGRGLAVAQGWAVDDAGAPPLWPWSRLMRTWPGALKILDPGTATGEPDAAARFRLFVAATDRIRAEASDRGLLLVLEDLHWADLVSVLLLRHLAGELVDAPICVLATYRDATPGPLLDVLPDLVRGDVARRLAIRELTAEEIGRWLPQLTGRADDALAAALHESTGGNPLLVRLVAEDMAAGNEQADPAVIRRAVQERPGLRRLVAARLAPLGPDVRRLVEAASVLGERLPADILAAMVDRSEEQIRVLLGEALDCGVLRTDGADIQFAHALVRDATYREVPAQRRAELHRRAAVALEDRRPAEAAGSIALHWQQAAGDDAVQRCGAWAEQADDRARAGLAFDTAARFARLAVACVRRSGDDPAEAARLLIRQAEAALLAHDLGASVAACVEAADAARRAGRPDLEARAALVVHGTGDPPSLQAIQTLCERALAVLPAEDAATRARLTAQLAVCVAERVDGARGAELALQALEAAQRCGDPAARLEAIAARHLTISVPQMVEERLALGREAVALGTAVDHPIAALWGHLWRVDAAFQLGNLPEVERELEQIDGIARRQGSPLARWHHHRFTAVGHQLAGRFAEARASNEAARVLAVQIGDLSMLGMHYAFQLQLAVMRGSIDELADGWEDLLRSAPPIPVVRLAVPLAHAVAGDLDLARVEFEEFRDLTRTYPMGMRWAGTVGQLAEIAIRLDDAEVCADVYEVLAPLASYYSGDGSGGVFSSGAVARTAGDLARVAGRHDEALQHYADATAMNGRIGARPFTALSRLGRARCLLGRPGSADRAADLAEAAELATAAAAEFRRLDMPGPLSTATHVLEAIARARRSVSPLTERETEVAALVADALSNRQIAERLVLSERTVESHVRSILGKLGFTTRTEIATWALRGKPAADLDTPGRS